MSVKQIAADHYKAQQTLARQAVEQAQALWSGVEAGSVVDSWVAQLAEMLNVLVSGQTAAAGMAQPYVDALAAAQGIPAAVGQVNPAALAGVAADGRTLTSLLMQPALRTLGLLARGADDQEALRSGLASLTRIVDTEISDASRVADHVGVVANRKWVTHVRVVSLPACSHCIILAGRQYSWSTGFQRHDRCDCGMAPWHEGDDTPATPDQLFAQMSEAEQNKAFTAAGAEALRLGADMSQIVNARRGMSTAGGKLVTSEGTTVRGVAGRRMKSTSGRRSAIRPMPEQLLADAGGDRDEAIRLLERFGYLSAGSTRRRTDAQARVAAAAERARQERARQEAEVAAEQARREAGQRAAEQEALQALSDEDLNARFNQALEAGDEPGIERAAAEMARRDEAVQPPTQAEPVESGSWGSWGDIEISDEDRRVDELVAQGWDFVDAYAEVYNVDAERLRREERSAAIQGDRLAGETIDQTVARLYRDWVHVQWLQAENATNGYLLNRAGQAAGIDPITLFSGPTSRATKYASEELRRWWNDHPRMTLTEFRAQFLGRENDKRAARTTREIGGSGI